MYDKYKYHEKVLIYLNKNQNEYLKNLELNKTRTTKEYGFSKDSFTSDQIANDLNIDVYKIKGTLLDLTELGFVEYNEYSYSLKTKVSAYIDSGYFKKKNIEYLELKSFNYARNGLVIILGCFSIYTFITSQTNPNTLDNQNTQELKCSIKSLERNVEKIKLSQEILKIRLDSLNVNEDLTSE